MDIDSVYQEILNQMSEGVYYTDENRKITFWNDAATEITGYSKEEMVGTHCYDNKLQHIDGVGCQLCKNDCPLARTIKTGQHSEANVYLHHKEGHRVEVNVKTTPIYDESGKIIGAVELFSDISNKFNSAKKLAELQKEIYIDPATKCANKHFAKSQIKKSLELWKDAEIPFSLCMISVELKKIKDTKEQETANRILKMIASSTTNALRPLDAVCRWSENQFISIISNIGYDSVENVCKRIGIFIENSWFESHENFNLDFSIGCVVVRKEDDREKMVERLSKALKEAKDKDKIVIL